MAKTITASKFSEWRGLDRISQIVHEMKCVFRELSKDDFGIDGEIEIAVPRDDGRSYEATGRVIKVQSKSGASYVTRDSDTSFVTPVEKSDLEYWCNSSVPVLFIVYHPKDDKLYYKEIRSYVRSTPKVFQRPWHVVFDKAADEFGTRCYESLCVHSEASPPRVLVGVKEKLYSNILPVHHRPKLVSCAPTTYSDHVEVRRELRGVGPPFRITGGTLYTFANLREPSCVLRRFCDAGSAETLESDDWVSDPGNRNDYTALLNELLRRNMEDYGLMYSRAHRRFYCPRPERREETESKVTWRNVRTGRESTRTVARYYEYGADRFWRHDAVYLAFLSVGTRWYLQVIPRYEYTTDGRSPFDSDRVGPYTTRIRAQETNLQILTDVLFWADVLSAGQDRIEFGLGGKPLVIIGKTPCTGVLGFAIPADPAVLDEAPVTGQLDLGVLWDEAGVRGDDLYEY